MNSHAAGGSPVEPHDEVAISVDNLTVTRGKRRVLDDFSCQIPRGRVTGLLGPSGSGKTTLMRAIVGADRGDATRAIGEVGLTDAAHQLTRDLSGGQLSRASLACALVGEPQLLVLDEPTVGQDPVLREDLWAVFHRYAQRGAAVLVSSHVMDEAKRCDALMLLRDGALLADNTPQGILRAADTDDMDTAFLTLIRRIGTEVTA
jgi:ABC-2 type transport system ATP-binding protein